MTELTKFIDDDIEKLVETIKPKIIGIMNDDEDNNKFYSAFTCPVSDDTYEMIKRDIDDIDEHTPESYRIDISDRRGPRSSHYAQTIEDAYTFIATKVARSVVNARQNLAENLAELNLAL